MRFLIIFLFSFNILAGDLESWKQLLNENKAVGLDIRTYPETKLNSAKGAVHLSFFDFNEKTLNKLKIDKDKTVLVFCESGGRASKAVKELNKAGYSKVINIKDWRTWNKLKN